MSFVERQKYRFLDASLAGNQVDLVQKSFVNWVYGGNNEDYDLCGQGMDLGLTKSSINWVFK